MSLNYKRGFTLIELLVVIAIIGILSAVILASLNTARSKGSDANVQSNLSNIRAQAEIDYDNSGCYSDTGTCTAFAKATCSNATANTLFHDSTIWNMISSAVKNGGGISSCMTTTGAANYAVVVQLKTDNKSAWCVDSTGISHKLTYSAALTSSNVGTLITSGGACNSTYFAS